MKNTRLRSAFGLIALLITFTLSAYAQSFPPTFSSNLGYNGANPFQTQQNYSFSRSPSLATDPTGAYPYLYMAYGSTVSDDYLYVAWTSDGITWSGKSYTTINTNSSPAIAFYNGYLWVAWISDGKNGLTQGALYVDYTNNPSAGFSASPIAVLNGNGDPYFPSSSPTMAVYNNKLWIASIDSYDNIVTLATTDGSSFSLPSACVGTGDPAGYTPQLNAQVGMAAFNGLMYFAYQTTAHTVRVCSSDGTYNNATYSSAGGSSAGGGVSATVYDGHLTFTFKDYSSAHPVIVGTTDGVNYTGETPAFSMNGSNQITPGTAVYNNHFYVVMTAPATNHKQWTAVGY